MSRKLPARWHLDSILEQAAARGATLLLTRMTADQVAALRPEHTRSSTMSRSPARPTRPPRIAVVAAGTSDAFVTREISRTLRYTGEDATSFVDVGLAGTWRVMDRIEVIGKHAVVIVVAGMDAALPTVVGGLVGRVVFAVPTSNG
jgi:NCAIR mutase (PurE)-related protein